jgi:Zn-dependent peptidase ImmA (M78 family)
MSILMKSYFKVSLQTLYRTLYEYNYISHEVYKKFWEDLFVNDLRKVEPNPLSRISIEDKNIRLINSIKELFEKEDISLNKVSVTLGLENQESRELIRKWREANGRYLLMP